MKRITDKNIEAAAPDLLAALEAIINSQHYYIKDSIAESNSPGYFLNRKCCISDESIIAARAAIAKAKGEIT